MQNLHEPVYSLVAVKAAGVAEQIAIVVASLQLVLSSVPLVL